MSRIKEIWKKTTSKIITCSLLTGAITAISINLSSVNDKVANHYSDKEKTELLMTYSKEQTKKVYETPSEIEAIKKELSEFKDDVKGKEYEALLEKAKFNERFSIILNMLDNLEKQRVETNRRLDKLFTKGS